MEEDEEDRSENKENKSISSSPGPEKRKITIVEGELSCHDFF